VTARGSWSCHAYGEGPCAHLCFFASSGRLCVSEQECDDRVAAERVRLFDLIQQRARQNPCDASWAALAAEFTSPDLLLNGGAEFDDL